MSIPVAVVLLAVLTGPAPGAAACPPASWDRAALLELKGRQFRMDDASQRQKLALDLAACLGSPDPVLRDGVAFEGLSAWMRGGLLAPETAGELVQRLMPQIAPGYPDPEGFLRPFAALVLSEAARMDRLSPYLGERSRQALLEAAAAYLRSVDDYRGFDAREGWRHGVAHGADLALQLGLNPALQKADLDLLLDALAVQIGTADTVYVHGEGERFARAVFFMATRRLHDQGDWEQWFRRVTAPAPMADWSEAFGSPAGLAKRHNLMAFLQALYLYVGEDGAAIRDRIASPLTAAIGRMP